MDVLISLAAETTGNGEIGGGIVILALIALWIGTSGGRGR